MPVPAAGTHQAKVRTGCALNSRKSVGHAERSGFSDETLHAKFSTKFSNCEWVLQYQYCM
eukprot:SAG11_NODE_2098_length_3827_cov_2.481223_5_plen_60_part_00